MRIISFQHLQQSMIWETWSPIHITSSSQIPDVMFKKFKPKSGMISTCNLIFSWFPMVENFLWKKIPMFQKLENTPNTSACLIYKYGNKLTVFALMFLRTMTKHVYLMVAFMEHREPCGVESSNWLQTKIWIQYYTLPFLWMYSKQRSSRDIKSGQQCVQSQVQTFQYTGKNEMHLREVTENTGICKVKFRAYIVIEHPRHYGPLCEITKAPSSRQIQVHQVVIIWY